MNKVGNSVKKNTMTQKYFVCLVMIILLFPTISCSEQKTNKDSYWQPKKTWVFMVAVEEWKLKNVYTSMPDPKREDQNLYHYRTPPHSTIFLSDVRLVTQPSTIPSYHYNISSNVLTVLPILLVTSLK